MQTQKLLVDLKKVLKKSFSLLDNRSRKRLILISILQTSLGFLDLLGVVIIGALGALTIQGVESNKPGNKVSVLLRFLHLTQFSIQTQVAILGITAGILLISKTIFSIIISRKILFFMARKSAEITTNLVARTISRDLQVINRRSTQELLYIYTQGINSLFAGVLAATLNVIGDSIMMVILAIGLFVIDPIVATCTLFIFISVALSLHKLLNTRARAIGNKVSQVSVKSNQKILEVLNSFREVLVRGQQAVYIENIKRLQMEKSESTAEQNFQPSISKYAIESITVIGILALASFEFGTKNATHAVATLAVFMAASSRIAPSTLRIQQGIISVQNNIGLGNTTADLIENLSRVEPFKIKPKYSNFKYEGFKPSIELKNIDFIYESSPTTLIQNFNLKIESGSKVAIVGPSGAGKTTIVDLILGVLEPSSGNVLISGNPPRKAATNWSGAISYVPQDVYITDGTIAQNVTLGFEDNEIEEERIWNALKFARLEELVKTLPLKLNSPVGELGSKLSGGQRQRLGIARALYTSPKLLVLDEATSALDAQTENELTELFSKVGVDVTLITIAHRLSTVRFVDKVIYIDNGEIQAIGTFEEVRTKVPNFELQANLMGL